MFQKRVGKLLILRMGRTVSPGFCPICPRRPIVRCVTVLSLVVPWLVMRLEIRHVADDANPNGRSTAYQTHDSGWDWRFVDAHRAK